ADVDIDPQGMVSCNKKGMSVFRSLADLPRLYRRLVPLRFAHKIRGATGSPAARIFSMGEGPFTSGPLTEKLELCESGGVHGSVCPSVALSLDALQNEIAGTRDSWKIDEPEL